MNAYEIADELDGRLDHKAANMLRKQADHIAELSKNVDELEEELLKAQQIKELNDEEIINLYKETKADNGGIREFVRALLKKASEK
jgi:archaellum component FlaC